MPPLNPQPHWNETLPDGVAHLLDVPRPLARAVTALTRQQGADGAFEGEVVWCPIITAQVVIARRIMGVPSDGNTREALLRHFARTQQSDGGWALHPEGPTYRFVTTLVYVAARLLGVAADEPLLHPAKAWLDASADAAWGLPSWGKFWLSLLGIYDPRDLQPLPPEVFLLPRRVPLSPWRFYCHTRYIYLGIAYLRGRRFRAELGPIADDLRQELFGSAPAVGAHTRRHALADTDAYVRPGAGLRAVYDVMHAAAPVARRLPGAAWLRRRALDRCLRAIRFEQRASNYQGLSPVNGVLNALALWSDDPGSTDAQRSLTGLEAWAWDDDTNGRRYAGARSTTWDTAFAMQALLAIGQPAPEVSAVLRRSYARLLEMQCLGTLEGGAEAARDAIDGGWCFSDGTHRWPVSDCTAEALSAILACHHSEGLIHPRNRLSPDRLHAAIRFILQRQNDDGGFGTYERRRGGAFLERLNPSEMFGQCMTELSYIECTGSALRALHEAQQTIDDGELRSAIAFATDRAAAFLLARQLPDGSWPGFWGINYIYGTLFAVTGLAAHNVRAEHPAMRRAMTWLRACQRDDGGWGEHFSGCLTQSYVPGERSLVISTSWALLALLVGTEGPTDAAMQRGAAWLAAHQCADGDWPRDSVNGVFFGTAMLDYRLYNTIFPLWALGEFGRRDAATQR